ncbi:MAG: DNA-3-methyladenine glycosylase [bacterium]
MTEEIRFFSKKIYLLPTLTIAKQLIGAKIIRYINDKIISGYIVETEAYLQNDPACHAVRVLPDGTTYHKKTIRNEKMFGLPGTAYVYFTYGNHFMLNVVTQPEGVPEAVLIRAIEPISGIEIMQKERNVENVVNLCNGPGKLTQAFMIDKSLNGHSLFEQPLIICKGIDVDENEIHVTQRIGITNAIDKPWRFYLKESKFISRK